MRVALSRVRGLKPNIKYLAYSFKGRTLTSAWIETPIVTTKCKLVDGRTLTSAWIETGNKANLA